MKREKVRGKLGNKALETSESDGEKTKAKWRNKRERMKQQQMSRAILFFCTRFVL